MVKRTRPHEDQLALDLRVKRCPRCERELPSWDFTKNKGRHDGLSVYCRKCWNIKQANYGKLPSYKANAERRWREHETKNAEKRKAQKHEYREAHLAKIAERAKEYHLENRDKIRERNRTRRQANREYYRARNRAFYEANSEKIKEYRRRYKQANRAALRESNRAYFLANRDKCYARGARRRARELAAATVPFTSNQLAERWAYYGNLCWLCYGPATATDHVKPLARGGAHMLCNLRPICKPCNSSKSAKWPFTREMVLRAA